MRGKNTHHQEMLITLNNLRMRRIRKITPPKLTPELPLLFDISY